MGLLATVAIVRSLRYSERMARASTMNVSLTPQLRSYVEARIASGKYESASEVVRDGLRALAQRDGALDAFWARVRDQVAEGMVAIERGDVLNGEAAMDALEAPLLRKTSARKRSKR